MKQDFNIYGLSDSHLLHDNILGFERRSETLFDTGQQFLSDLEPSIVRGALMSYRRRAATKVTVFQ